MAKRFIRPYAWLDDETPDAIHIDVAAWLAANARPDTEEERLKAADIVLEVLVTYRGKGPIRAILH